MFQCSCGKELHTHTSNSRFRSLPTIMLNDLITHVCYTCEESFTEIPKLNDLFHKIKEMLATKEVPNIYEYRFILKELFPDKEFKPLDPEPKLEYNMMFISEEWIFIT